MSQSAKKISGDFPPSSRETFFRLESAQDLSIVIVVIIIIILILVMTESFVLCDEDDDDDDNETS